MKMTQKTLNVLAFFAHPDDETMFLGGTLAFLAERGAEVHYLSATRGEGGEMGDPPVCQRSDLGRIRDEELRCAVQALGGASLDFLGFVDPDVGPDNELYPFSPDLAEVVGKLKERVLALQPDVILSHGPGGEYGHPAHIQVHQALTACLADLEYQPRAHYAPCWLSWEAGEFIPKPDVLVDVSPWLAQKTEAAICHASQHGLFTRHGSARAGRPVTVPEIVRSQEALVRILPQREAGEADPLAGLLQEIALPTVGKLH
jgi:N-acetylglucosamine malate deacetylase 2